MRRGLVGVLAGVLLATPGHALEATYRLGVPYYVDPGVGGLFPGGQRLGGGAEFTLSGPWSVSLDAHWLHQDWGSTRYSLALTPLLLRHRLTLGGDPEGPFITLGMGGAAMALLGGGEPLKVGLGPAFAAGIGLPLGRTMLAQLELQQGAIHTIHYLGLGLSLGMRLGVPEPSRMKTSKPQSQARLPLKPPLPRGQLLKVGQVAQVQGSRVRLALDDLPYRVQAGDVLVIYYHDRMPIKVAKIRVETVEADGRGALGDVLAATEAIQRGYLLGTL